MIIHRFYTSNLVSTLHNKSEWVHKEREQVALILRGGGKKTAKENAEVMMRSPVRLSMMHHFTGGNREK